MPFIDDATAMPTPRFAPLLIPSPRVAEIRIDANLVIEPVLSIPREDQ